MWRSTLLVCLVWVKSVRSRSHRRPFYRNVLPLMVQPRVPTWMETPIALRIRLSASVVFAHPFLIMSQVPLLSTARTL